MQATLRELLAIQCPPDNAIVLLVGCSAGGGEDPLQSTLHDLTQFYHFAYERKWHIHEDEVFHRKTLQKDEIMNKLRSFFRVRLQWGLRILVLAGHGDENGSFLCGDGEKTPADIITPADIMGLRPPEDVPLFILADYCDSGGIISHGCLDSAPTYVQASCRSGTSLDGVFMPFFLEAQRCQSNGPKLRDFEPALRTYVMRNGQIPKCRVPSEQHRRREIGCHIQCLETLAQRRSERKKEALANEALPLVAPEGEEERCQCPWKCKKSKRHPGTHKRICGKLLDAKVQCGVCLDHHIKVVRLPCGKCMCSPCFIRLGFKLPDQSDSSS